MLHLYQPFPPQISDPFQWQAVEQTTARLTQVNLDSTTVQLQWLPLVVYPVFPLVSSEAGFWVLHSRCLAH